MDGFPRNEREAEFFLESYDIDGVIRLDLPDSEVRRRVMARRLCSGCGVDYNLLASSPQVPGKCDVCGGDLVTREDDTEEALAVRLREYHQKTNPVLDIFRRKEYVITVDARPDPEQIQQTIRTRLRLPPARPAQPAGTGELIVSAVDAGARRLVIALGGSASTDGGTGALAALGVRFLDAAGRELPVGGGALGALASAALTGLRPPPPGGVVCLTDVRAPLLGPRGAAAVFGPQKGAGAAQVAVLEAGLARLARVLGGDPGPPGPGPPGRAAPGLPPPGGARTPPPPAPL